MTAGALRRIKTVEPKPGYRLVIALDSDAPFTISLESEIQRGGVFSALRDMALFSRVRVGERRRTIEWPEPRDRNGNPLIDIDAEALYVMGAREQHRGVLQRVIDFLEKLMASRETAKAE